MPSTILTNCNELGWTSISRYCGTRPGPTAASVQVSVNTLTPLRTADQDAILVWLTESKPRLALSFGATVKRSRIRQSLVGCVSMLPDQMAQLFKSNGCLVRGSTP